MKATIRVLDEVNVKLFNVTSNDINIMREATKIFLPEARHTAAYKLKHWDGKESNISASGATYVYMLKKVVPMLIKLGYEVELNDLRKPITLEPALINKDFLIDYGIEFRPHQVSGINSIITNRAGFIDFATSAGKTLIVAGIVKLYESLPTITIVPSDFLAKQTFADVSRVNDDVAMITGKVVGKKREAAWNAQHLIITWQTLKNNKPKARKYSVFLYDEAHIMGDTMFDILGNYLNEAFIRVGLTGTIVEDKFKYEKCACLIGGDILETKEAHVLMKEGHISTVDIEMIGLTHELELPLDPYTNRLDWDDENEYLGKNPTRVGKICDVISTIRKGNKGNFLILCFPEVGKKIAEILETDFIDKDTPEAMRATFFAAFDSGLDYELVASYGTVGTGVSVDNIQYMFLIDAGGNKTRIKQGIGRGLRKDGSDNHLKVFDIYTKIYRMVDNKMVVYNFGGTKHVAARKKIYKELQYPFKELSDAEIT